jgi:hypothetical protein
LAAGNAGEDGDEDAPVERRYTARIEALESEGRTLSEVFH